MNPSPIILIIKKSFWIIYDHLGMLVLLNLIWWVAAFLIIPLPPVTAAIFVITNKMANYKPVDWRDFSAGFSRYFGRSWLLGAVVGLFALIFEF